MTEEELKERIARLDALTDRMNNLMGKLEEGFHAPTDCDLKPQVESLLITRAKQQGFLLAVGTMGGVVGGGIVTIARIVLKV